MVDSLQRLEDNGQKPFTCEQLAALVQKQKELLDQYSPYDHQPTIGAILRQRWGNLRTPMQVRPTQQAYDITRSAAQALTSQPHSSSSSGDPSGGESSGLPDSALRKLTQALERNYNQVPLPNSTESNPLGSSSMANL